MTPATAGSLIDVIHDLMPRSALLEADVRWEGDTVIRCRVTVCALTETAAHAIVERLRPLAGSAVYTEDNTGPMFTFGAKDARITVLADKAVTA